MRCRMARTSGSDEMGSSSSLPSARQHPLLLWFDLLDTAEYKGPLFRYWLSLGAYYLLLFACAWYVLQWFRRGRPWARARSSVAGGHKKGDVGGGAIENKKNTAPPALLYKESARNRRLLSKTTVLRQPYIPSPWLGHRVSSELPGMACRACLEGCGSQSCVGEQQRANPGKNRARFIPPGGPFNFRFCCFAFRISLRFRVACG